MPKNYKVKQGDCLASIAAAHGFMPETIWQHPNNEQLRELRDDWNVLRPGDMVFIPDIRPAVFTCATGKRHVFKLKNTPVYLRLRLFGLEGARANEAFTLTVDGGSDGGV